MARAVKISRSAKNGRFVTKSYARSHKSTTVTEIVRVGRKRSRS